MVALYVDNIANIKSPADVVPEEKDLFAWKGAGSWKKTTWSVNERTVLFQKATVDVKSGKRDRIRAIGFCPHLSQNHRTFYARKQYI